MTFFLKLHDLFTWNIHFLLYGVQRVVSTLHTASLDAGLKDAVSLDAGLKDAVSLDAGFKDAISLDARSDHYPKDRHMKILAEAR